MLLLPGCHISFKLSVFHKLEMFLRIVLIFFSSANCGGNQVGSLFGVSSFYPVLWSWDDIWIQTSWFGGISKHPDFVESGLSQLQSSGGVNRRLSENKYSKWLWKRTMPYYQICSWWCWPKYKISCFLNNCKERAVTIPLWWAKMHAFTVE